MSEAIRGRQRSAIAAVFAALLLVCGCQATGEGLENSSFAEDTDALRDVPEVTYYASDKALAAGKNFFRQKHYGKAENAFRQAVELEPKDGEAWLGLAASYDRIRRFDLADRAYSKVYELLGPSFVYYNNIGYSYLLRGDLRQARANFNKAYELEPSNIVVTDNIRLLSDSVRSINR